MKENLEVNSKVFDINSDMFSIGMDMYSCYWCPNETEYKTNLLNKTSGEIRSKIRSWGYDYFLIGPRYLNNYGTNLTVNSLYFTPILQHNDFHLFEVVK